MLSPKHNLVYSRSRMTRNNGSFYDVVEVVAPDVSKLEFHKSIDSPSQMKLDDIAQLRMLKAMSRGVPNPTVLVWEAYGHEETVEDKHWKTHLLANNRSTNNRSTNNHSTNNRNANNHSTETVHISKNSFITHHLRYLVASRNYVIHNGLLQVKNLATKKDRQAQEVLDELHSQERIKLHQGNPGQTLEEVYLNFHPMKDVVAVGRIGFPSLHGRLGNYPIVFNTSFFLFEEEDYISEFSLLGDPYNLQIQDGVIASPPLFNRSALLVTSGGEVEIRQISLQDLKIKALGREWDLANFSLNEDQVTTGDYSLYTRYFGVKEMGKTWGKTPKAPGKMEFIIIDRSIVGFKRGGETEIPHNGFILSLPENDVPIEDIAIKVSNEVSYSFLNGHYHAGIQCGPGLLRNGEIILNGQTLRNEEFFRKRMAGGEVVDFGVVPTDYAEDIDQTQAARLAFGVDFQGRLRILAVESVNRGMEEVTGESSGATLLELSQMLKSRGYKHALNLDGGGSANIQYFYGHLVKGADRRGLPGVTYERLIPSVGVILK